MLCNFMISILGSDIVLLVWLSYYELENFNRNFYYISLNI